MAPTCTNCSGNDFVWANELKTSGGMGGGGGLSLRPRGEVPLGARICRTCGHAELFLRDLALLHQPASWKPGEFISIPHKPRAPPPGSHVARTEPASAPAPEPQAPVSVPPPPEPPQAPPAPEPEPATPAPLDEPVAPPPVEASPAASPDEAPVAPDTSVPKSKSPRRRSAKPKV